MYIPVSKTLDQVRDDLFAKLAFAQEKGWLPEALNLNRGVVRGLIELWAWGTFKLYEFLFAVLEHAIPYLSGGAWLELHAKQVDVLRKPATKAQGRVTFYRVASQTGNIRIPKGRIVKTLPDGRGEEYRYTTTGDVVLQAGFDAVEVPVVSETYGREANASTGQICKISTHMPGIDRVSNGADWLDAEGTDLEDDVSLRERYALQWRAVNGLTKYFYEALALRVTGVISVAIHDQHPRGQGTVDIVVRGAAGIPTEKLLEEVRAEVEASRPQNDHVLVKAPVACPVTIRATLELVSGSEEGVKAAVENRLRALFTEPLMLPGVPPLKIGDDLPLDRLVGVIMQVQGVKRVIWEEPQQDIAIPGDGLAILDGIHLSIIWAPEA